MKEINKPTQNDPTTEQSSKVLDFTQKQYSSFKDFVEFRDGDPIWMLGYKLVLRFLGIGVMILLSPFLILGLFIAFLAVM